MGTLKTIATRGGHQMCVNMHLPSWAIHVTQACHSVVTSVKPPNIKSIHESRDNKPKYAFSVLIYFFLFAMRPRVLFLDVTPTQTHDFS